MPYNVIVSGLPEIPKINKLVFIFKAVLKEVGITKFWIRKIGRLPNTSLNQALVELYSFDDASFAAKRLDGYKLLLGNIFPLSARIDGPIAHPSCHRPRSPHERRMESRNYYIPEPDTRVRKRLRSSSPFDLDVCELDLEIQLLKKKRLIIEEERRLLMEQKKLDLVQALGPSALRELDDLEEARDHHRWYRSRQSPEPYSGRRLSPRREPRGPVPRNSRLAPPSHGPHLPEPFRFQAAPIVSSEGSKDRQMILGLPQFVMPCKLILKEMTEVIGKHARPEEIEHVRHLIRSALRSRLAVIMDRQPVLRVERIIKLYRDSHPLATDDQFVIMQLKNLRACHMPGTARSSESNEKDKTADRCDLNTKEGKNKVNEIKANSIKKKNKLNQEKSPKADRPSASAMKELANQFMEDEWATGASADGWTDWNTIMDMEAMDDQLISKMPHQ